MVDGYYMRDLVLLYKVLDSSGRLVAMKGIKDWCLVRTLAAVGAMRMPIPRVQRISKEEAAMILFQCREV